MSTKLVPTAFTILCHLPIEPKMKVWRTTLIDQSIPRWADGSPYLVIAPKKPAECDFVTREIRALGFDHIVAVDTGGDTLSMTAASNTGKEPGRDQRMLAILKDTGIPTSLVVIDPGSDGETPYEDMRATVISRLNLGNYQRWCLLRDPAISKLSLLQTPHG